MPIFATFLASAFTGILTFIADSIAKRTIVFLAFIAAFLTITITFYNLLTNLLEGLIYLVPNDTFRMIFFSIFPDNFATCITAKVSAEALLFIYNYKKQVIKVLAQV